jgi:hypothetical protein
MEREQAVAMNERNSRIGASISIVFALIALLCVTMLKASGDSKAWQAGTIVEVKAHQVDANAAADTGAKQYDVSIKVGKKIYVALYILDKDQASPEYYVGMRRPVLVESDTIKFNDLLGHTHTLKILSSKDAPASDAK